MKELLERMATPAPAARPSLEALQVEKTAIEDELAELRARRTDVAERLPAVRGRKEGLAVEVSTAVLEGGLDGKAAVSLRREYVAAVAGVEELEGALRVADERIAGLEARVAGASRRLAIVGALEQIDRVKEIAAQVDAAWAPVREQLAELILAAEDVAGILTRVLPGRYGLRRDALARVLLHPLGDLLDLPSPEVRERLSAQEFFSYPKVRATLEAELAEEKGAPA